jgi:dolichyl-phosphate-mannose--protein O-mannosyl transferase
LKEHLPHLVLNLLLQGLNALLVFAISLRLSRGEWLVALAAALIAATSRFALYQVTQVTGLLEGLALIFFLATVYCVVRAYGDGHAA